jgi:hypothetical protein
MMAFCALTSLAFMLAACDVDATTVIQMPTPTPVPYSGPPIHRLPLPNFQASLAVPGPHGVLLYGAPHGMDPLINLPAFPGAQSLYYYDLATQTIQAVTTLSAAEEQELWHITYATVEGDTVIYIKGPEVGEPSEVHLYNLLTRHDRLLASAEQVAVDARTILWAQQGPSQWLFETYDLASGTTTSHAVALGSVDPPTVAGVVPRALLGKSVVYSLISSVFGSSITITDFLWTLDSRSAPQQLTTGNLTGVALTDSSVVWTDSSTQSLTLYDRETADSIMRWVSPCIRPAMSPDRPYAVCLNNAASTLQLVHLPDGSAIPLSRVGSMEEGAIANDRAYWIEPTGHTLLGTTLDYIDLPAQLALERGDMQAPCPRA